MCTAHSVYYACGHIKLNHLHECSGVECTVVDVFGKSMTLEQECRRCRRQKQKDEKVEEWTRGADGGKDDSQGDSEDGLCPGCEWDAAVVDERPGQ